MVWKKKLRSSQYTFNSERVFLVATQPGKSIYSCLQTTKLGLTLGEVQERQSIYGRNEVIHEQKRIRLYCLSERLSILSLAF